jgi:hypothetical protein
MCSTIGRANAEVEIDRLPERVRRQPADLACMPIVNRSGAVGGFLNPRHFLATVSLSQTDRKAELYFFAITGFTQPACITWSEGRKLR